MPNFDECLFPPKLSFGARGGPGFLTAVITPARRPRGVPGREQRIRQWKYGRWAFDVSHVNRTPAFGAEMEAFFIARGGKERAFRFKDWLDYSTKRADGTQLYHPLARIDETTFQLQKVYVSSGPGSYIRKIVKPVSDTLGDPVATADNSTVRIYNSTDPLAGWTVDCSSGIVTFAEDPGLIPIATFQFHVPVRFVADRQRMTYDDVGARSLHNIALIEVEP